MDFKKLTLAAAVAAAVTPALAQKGGGGRSEEAASLQVYGLLYPHFVDERGSGATGAGVPVSTITAVTPTGVNGVLPTKSMVSANSRLGFRGVEPLGGGWKAGFQLEGVAAVDEGGPAGGFTFGRNTFVELDGPFGNLRLGNHDTIFKEYGDTLGILGLSSGSFMSSTDVLRKFGSASASSFHLRRTDSVRYETPEFAGFQGGFLYSRNEVAGGARTPRVLSYGIKYDEGPLYLALAQEKHIDLFGGSANVPAAMRNSGATDPAHSHDTATEFVVEYRFFGGRHKVEFDAVHKSYKETATVAGRFVSYRSNSFLIATDNRWSNEWRTAAHYVRGTAGSCERVLAACDSTGLEAWKATVAVQYSFSKRTSLFAAYSKLANGKSARFNNSGQTPNPGEDIQHIAVGLAHRF